ncbi:39807_t:CDS:1, partial [Gigaspora margarita]
FQEISNFNSESDLSEEESDISFNIQENQNDPEIIVKEIKNIIYNSLFEYWDRTSQICLLAILLDPRIKEMAFANDNIRNQTIEEYQLQLYQFIPPSEEHPISSNLTNISSNNMFKDMIFGIPKVTRIYR